MRKKFKSFTGKPGSQGKLRETPRSAPEARVGAADRLPARGRAWYA